MLGIHDRSLFLASGVPLNLTPGQDHVLHSRSQHGRRNEEWRGLGVWDRGRLIVPHRHGCARHIGGARHLGIGVHGREGQSTVSMTLTVLANIDVDDLGRATEFYVPLWS